MIGLPSLSMLHALLSTFNSSPTFWSLLAIIPVIVTEYMFRTVPGGWFGNLHYYLPMQLLVSYCVYRLVTMPGMSLVEAFVIWAISTSVARVILSVFVLHDHVSNGTWMALALILVAKLAQSIWK